MCGKRIDKLDDKEYTRSVHALQTQYSNSSKFLTKRDERLTNSIQLIVGLELLEVGQIIRELRIEINKLNEIIKKESKKNVGINS